MSGPASGPRPSVSVAISSYNYGRYIRSSIESALTQQDVDLEVIVVDDCSSDDSVAVVRDLMAEDSRISLVVHETNRGHIATANESLWAARGDYVVKLDSDDMLTAGALRRAADVLTANPSVGLVYGNPLTFVTDPPEARLNGHRYRLWRGADWIGIRARKATNCIMQPEALVRTSVLRQTDGHREDLPAAHDLNLWLRIAALSDVARLKTVDQGFYRVHDDSLLRSRYPGYLSDLKQRRDAFDNFYASVAPGTLLEAYELRDLTHRRLARQAVAFVVRAFDTDRTNSEDLDVYIDFAREVYPGVEGLPEWRQLSRRRKRGAVASASFGPYRVAELRRTVEDKLRWRSWRRFGV